MCKQNQETDDIILPAKYLTHGLEIRNLVLRTNMCPWHFSSNGVPIADRPADKQKPWCRWDVAAYGASESVFIHLEEEEKSTAYTSGHEF